MRSCVLAGVVAAARASCSFTSHNAVICNLTAFQFSKVRLIDQPWGRTMRLKIDKCLLGLSRTLALEYGVLRVTDSGRTDHARTS